MLLKRQLAWGIDHLSRKPAPVFDQLVGKEMFPHVKSEAFLTQLWAIRMHPVNGYKGEEISTSLSTSTWFHLGVSAVHFQGSMGNILKMLFC